MPRLYSMPDMSGVRTEDDEAKGENYNVFHEEKKPWQAGRKIFFFTFF